VEVDDWRAAMNLFMKRLILGSTALQGIVLRASGWLVREKYSGIDKKLFIRLVQCLSVFENHGGKLKRFGSQFDGGYILLDLEKSYSKLISFGVGDNIDFEKSLMDCVDEIELYDHTIEALPIHLPNAKFFRIGLSQFTKDGFIDLNSVTPEGFDDMILKIDVEGDEWKSLAVFELESLTRYAQIVIELHDLHRIDSREKLLLYVSVLETLHHNHELVFAHANNWSPVAVINGYLIPDALEVTFVRCNLLPSGSQDRKFLDILHAPNNPKAAHIPLNF
jgi:hypothetical protein